MDSLLANYASSDDEEENQHQNSVSCSKPNSSLSLFSSLPHPKSSSLSSSLTQFKHQSSTPIIHHNNNNSSSCSNSSNNNNVKVDEDDLKPSSKSFSSLFSLLAQPKNQALQQPVSNISSLDPTPKRVVQFKLPINPSYVKPSDLDDEDDEDEGEKERKGRKESDFLSQSSSVKSFLSSIPAPRNSSTFGVLPSAAGSGRRSIVETKAPATSSGGSFGTQKDQNTDQSGGVISASYVTGSDESEGNYVNFGGYGSGIDQYICQNVNTGDDGSSYGCYESYGIYGSYDDYGQHGNNWSDGQATAVPESTGPSESAFRVPGKRGRKDIPTEVIEVKQDELTKNRPREDQVKLTGIAFGPSYQPAASTKGKPTKLHKRKHQIGSLYYDMKQKEMELAERRAKGFLTKAQTQAKYGW